MARDCFFVWMAEEVLARAWEIVEQADPSHLILGTSFVVGTLGMW